MLLFQWKTWRSMMLTSEIVQDKVKEKVTSYFSSFIHILLQRAVHWYVFTTISLCQRANYQRMVVEWRYPFHFDYFFNELPFLHNILFHTANTRSGGLKIKSGQHPNNWNPDPSLKLLQFICNALPTFNYLQLVCPRTRHFPIWN